MARSPSITLYNQDRFDDDVFLAGFVARGELVKALIASLRHIAKGGPTQHQILIGARGMGKTSLLRRVAIAIMQDSGLDAAFIPLRFREEQYNIISLDAFWRNCGESLAEYCEQRGDQMLADWLDIAIESSEWRDADFARDEFLSACERAGGRAVLLLDNLDLILDGIKEDGCWSLRAALQLSTGPIVIGASTQLLAQGGDRNAAFYEFFNPQMLEPLSERELLACLNALADRRGEEGAPVRALLAKEPERVRALYVLTGGNPRILGLVYKLLEQADSDTIFADLEALLDQVTPFYKARIEEYQTPLQRAIIDGIALNWDPITSSSLAKTTGIEPTTLSPQLIRLKKDGLIEDVETSGTRVGFQLSERFLNIWYLMRHGTRKTKQRLRWFTIFLTKLFSADELQLMAGDARTGAGGRWHPDHCAAVIEAYELKLRSSISGLASLPDDLFSSANTLFDAGRFDDAVATYEEILTRLGAADDTNNEILIAATLFNKGVALGVLGRSDEEIAAYDEVTARFGTSNDPELQEQTAMALVNKGVALGVLGRDAEAIAAYDEVAARFGTSNVTEIQEQIAKALLNKGVRLGTLGRIEEEIAAYDDLTARFASGSAIELQEQVAMALVNKGISFGLRERNEDAIAAFDELLTCFGTSDVPKVQEMIAMALVNKGFEFSRLGRYEEALAALVDILERFGTSDASGFQAQVAMALLNKGFALGKLGRSEEAIVAYDEIVARFCTSEVDDLQEQVAKALFNKGVRLGVLGRDEDAIAAYDEVAAHFGSSEVAELQMPVAKALLNKGFTLITLERAEEAVAAYNEIEVRFGTSGIAELQEPLATARVRSGAILFWDLAQEDAGLAKLRQAFQTDPSNLFVKANLLWMYLAAGEFNKALAISADLDVLDDGGRTLMRAGLELAADNLGTSLVHLSKALDQGLSGKFDYSEDLIWYLRIATERGYGERMIDWFIESGNADRYAPIYGALVAHVRGERFLRDLNPEVRGVAQPIFAKLTGGRKHTREKAEKSTTTKKRQRRKL